MFPIQRIIAVLSATALLILPLPPAAADSRLPATTTAPDRLTHALAIETLDAFEDILHRRHAHAAIVGFDISAAIQNAKQQLDGDISLNELIFLMEAVLAPIGDGHASIRIETSDARDARRGIADGESAHFLPFRAKMLAESPGDPVIAIRTDRAGFVDDDHPVLETIDGLPINDWIAEISNFIPAGAPAYMRSRALRQLRDLWRWRERLGVADTPQVTLGLASLDGTSRTTVTLTAAARPSSYIRWPETESRMLDGNIGYIRIPTMRRDPDELDDYRDLMDQFKDTRGLIIDVRGNSGGRRHILNMFGTYLMPPDADPVIYIAVRPFMVDGERPLSDHLRGRMAHRYIFPPDHDGWSERERLAIQRFRQRFEEMGAGPKPHARLDNFADWHYAVLSADGGGIERHERTYHYDKPVIVLMDEFCFSSTDNFIHAMSLIPGVTLMGRPSAASSGAPMVWDLPIEGLAARIASMASWRSSGRRFDDGTPLEPDIRVDPLPTCYIGQTDYVLERAIRHLIAD